MRHWLNQFIFSVLSIVISFTACEITFRYLLFSDAQFMGKFKNPGLYFNYFVDDKFWVLNFLFGEPIGKAPHEGIHPLLGWIGDYDGETFIHHDIKNVGARRAVLMYGDSFGQCVTKKCFQHYFNEDPDVSKKCYFLNYSTGGHGIDQTFLVMQKSLPKFQKPIVIYSLLTQDLDRATLSAFTGQKPYFQLENGQLKLKGVPIDPSPEHFFNSYPLNIPSYLYRLLSRREEGVTGFRTDPSQIPKIQAIARPILKAAITELKNSGADFFVLVFVPNWVPESYIEQPDEQDWRLMTITSLLKEESVPYLVTKDAIRAQVDSGKVTLDQLAYSKTEGHPSDIQNEIIYQQIKSKLSMCRD